MRKFNKLFILISIILLSFTCISCKKSDEDRIREIFKSEQLNGYVDVSNEKSKIVSRLKDSVKWSDKLNRDVDYYDLNDIYNFDLKHLSTIRYKITMKTEYLYDNDYVDQIMYILFSVPYVEIEYEEWPYVIESINKEYMFSNVCVCGNCFVYYESIRFFIYIYNNGYVHLEIQNFNNDEVVKHYISLIQLEDNYKDIISDAKLEDYID